ncbi:hypothetical protein CERSUDRAFT_118186 [Gelatoporia subvermispora B]|uniref:Uncharacterized protein n=1 Tax=Ceriporiopsis subvermispora (strain B) TaxID=914234 RepID=M2PBX6_CERS8|nr:hypothetical protein CERSUDRAFT_118186 [Gelatoporia subvermispora B]
MDAEEEDGEEDDEEGDEAEEDASDIDLGSNIDSPESTPEPADKYDLMKAVLSMHEISQRIRHNFNWISKVCKKVKKLRKSRDVLFALADQEKVSRIRLDAFYECRRDIVSDWTDEEFYGSMPTAMLEEDWLGLYLAKHDKLPEWLKGDWEILNLGKNEDEQGYDDRGPDVVEPVLSMQGEDTDVGASNARAVSETGAVHAHDDTARTDQPQAGEQEEQSPAQIFPGPSMDVEATFPRPQAEPPLPAPSSQHNPPVETAREVFEGSRIKFCGDNADGWQDAIHRELEAARAQAQRARERAQRNERGRRERDRQGGRPDAPIHINVDDLPPVVSAARRPAMPLRRTKAMRTISPFLPANEDDPALPQWPESRKRTRDAEDQDVHTAPPEADTIQPSKRARVSQERPAASKRTRSRDNTAAQSSTSREISGTRRSARVRTNKDTSATSSTSVITSAPAVETLHTLEEEADDEEVTSMLIQLDHDDMDLEGLQLQYPLSPAAPAHPNERP